MEKNISKVVKTPMSVDTMKEYMEKKNMNFVFLYDINNVSTLGDVFKNKSYIILFVATKSKYNGHYVGMVKDDANKTIYFFDPYGMSLMFLLKKFPGGEPFDYLQSQNIIKLINKSGYNLISNTKDYQKINKSVATCGRLSLMFLILYRIITKHYKLNFTFGLMENAMNCLQKKMGLNYDNLASYFINRLN